MSASEDYAIKNVGAALPTDPAERKATPIATGVLDYFPLAIAEVARVSKVGNDQHNPGQPMHWAKDKSTDHADCIARHLIDRGTFDKDGMRHSAKVAWRALAMLQIELESEAAKDAAFAELPPAASTEPKPPTLKQVLDARVECRRAIGWHKTRLIQKKIVPLGKNWRVESSKWRMLIYAFNAAVDAAEQKKAA